MPADSPYQTLDDLLAAARKKPERIAFGSAGIGTPSHIAGELLQRAAGVQLTHVAYRGSGPSLADVMGGQIPVAISTLVAAAGHIESGNLRALAVTSKKRWPSLPNVPAVSESGMPDYEHMTWLGVFAPKGTPREITTLLNRQIHAVLSEPEMQERISKMGGSVMLLNQAEFEQSIAQDFATSTRLVRETQLKAD